MTVTTTVLELYGNATGATSPDAWKTILAEEACPFTGKRCIKNRKSEPGITIGTCSLLYGKRQPAPLIICPNRLLERRQIFVDCIHLLTLHEPGSELHLVSELTVPGGSVDYCLASVREGKVKDFVGIELQALDTTGTVWPERQRLLAEFGFPVRPEDVLSKRKFGMNWKMTAKTILIQLHHKLETFENVGKHFVLVAQDHFLAYAQREFRFEGLADARLGDSLHIHPYNLARTPVDTYRLILGKRLSTDANGLAAALGLQDRTQPELDEMLRLVQARISESTLLNPLN